jgi:hypothetical protein
MKTVFFKLVLVAVMVGFNAQAMAGVIGDAGIPASHLLVAKINTGGLDVSTADEFAAFKGVASKPVALDKAEKTSGKLQPIPLNPISKERSIVRPIIVCIKAPCPYSPKWPMPRQLIKTIK